MRGNHTKNAGKTVAGRNSSMEERSWAGTEQPPALLDRPE